MGFCLQPRYNPRVFARGETMSASGAAEVVHTYLNKPEELARKSGLDTLDYLLAVAKLEAETHIRDKRLNPQRHNEPLWTNVSGVGRGTNQEY